MISYEGAAAPAVRAAEAVLAGRRIAGRALPYGAESAHLRFDPIERRFLFPRAEPLLRPGPFRPDAWRDALARIPPGPVLVGPGADAGAEALWAAGRAAAEAALEAGRPIYLLDASPAAVPVDARDSAVLLCSWRPGRPESAFPGLDRFASAGSPRAALFPLLPGWTAEDDAIAALADAAKRGGAASLTAVVPASDGEGRRAIVDARSLFEPLDSDRFFEVIHHGDWTASGSLAGPIAAVRKAATDRGLALLPPRPAGRREPPGNRAAAARLEEDAELSEAGEHRAALMHAAVRWIDESDHDLSAVAREGNFRKVFPFEGAIAERADACLREAWS